LVIGHWSLIINSSSVSPNDAVLDAERALDRGNFSLEAARVAVVTSRGT
jgi:hypothetical protein